MGTLSESVCDNVWESKADTLCRPACAQTLVLVNPFSKPLPEFGLIFRKASSWNFPVACSIKLYGFPFYGKEEKLRRKFKGSSIKHFSLN